MIVVMAIIHDTMIKFRIPQPVVRAVAEKATRDGTTSSAMIRGAIQRELEGAR